jgi:hypothetical protein
MGTSPSGVQPPNINGFYGSLTSQRGQELAGAISREMTLINKRLAPLDQVAFLEGHRFVSGEKGQQHLVFFDDNGTIRIMDEKGENGRPLGAGRDISLMALSQDLKLLALVDKTGKVQLWDLIGRALVTSRDLGTELARITFVGDSLYALDLHNNLIVLGPTLDIVARINIDSGHSIAAARQWFFTSGNVGVGVRGFRWQRGEIIPLEPKELSRYISGDYFKNLLSGPSLLQRGVLLCLVWIREVNRVYSSLSTASKGTLCLILLFVLTSVWWIFRPGDFIRWAMEPLVETSPSSWKVAINWLNCARSLGLTHRSRDAWVRTRAANLVQQLFLVRSSVERRKDYAELGTKAVIDAWNQAIADGTTCHIWIHGPGGYGKSALAFHLARIASQANGVPQVIPLVIEEDWGADMYRYCSSRLEYQERRPSKALLQKLGGSAQILAIVDGVSERRMLDAVDQVELFERDSGFRLLVVTSRDEPRNLGKWVVVKVGPVEPQQIIKVLHAYRIPSQRIDELEVILIAFVKNKSASQLLLRIAIENLLRGLMLPQTYAELVQQYVLGLRPVLLFSEDDFLRLARLAAEGCVLPSLAPTQVTSEYMIGFLAKESLITPFITVAGTVMLAAAALDELVRCGLMFRLFVRGSGYVGFSEDPVSEYLAAMQSIGRGAQGIASLRELLKRSPQQTQGLNKALDDVLDWKQAAHIASGPAPSLPTA